MKPSILFLTRSSNWPLTDGKRQRTWFLIEALSKKFAVDVLLIGYQKDKDEFNINSSSVNKLYFEDIDNLNFSKAVLPSYLLSKKQSAQNKLLTEKLNTAFYDLYDKNKYSYVFSRYLQPLLLMNFQKDIKIICDLDDVYFENQHSKIQNETNFRQKLKFKILYFLEAKKVKQLINRIDFPIVVKGSDRSFYGLENAICLPNLPFSFFINQEKPHEVINSINELTTLSFGFIGKLSYKPNYQALINFITLIWNPLMRNKLDARLVIAGSGTAPKILETIIKASKNIDFIGFVETPELFWDRVSALLIPVTMGGGSNIKIAEAFIHGKTVISYPFASRGYESFVDTNYLKIAQDKEEMASIMSSFVPLKNHESQMLSQKAKELFDLEKWNQILLSSL